MVINPGKKYHFIGIGGTGMSSLACLSAKAGAEVSGSDRLLDGGKDRDLFGKMRSFGIRLYPQDGAGLQNSPDAVIASPAVERSNPDLVMAGKLKLMVMERAEFLIGLTEGKKAVGIAGTSGKSTITAMVAHIMTLAGLDPTVVLGARMRNYETADDPGSSILGRSPWFCFEADESDGQLARYRCHTALVSNIEKDHKEIAELTGLFRTFLSNTTDIIIVNADCPLLAQVVPGGGKVLTYAVREHAAFRASDVALGADGSCFSVRGQRFMIRQPGGHNISNAVAATATASSLGIPLADIAGYLETFSGLRRRMEVVGESGGITIVDDFAHSPAKIRAALETASLLGKRRIVIYQPHGYGPTLFLRRELIEAFSCALSPTDHLFILDIYYAGGTARKEITSDDLVRGIARTLPSTTKPSCRRDLIRAVSEIALDGDVIMVLGARDRSLTNLAESIHKELQSRSRTK